MKTIQYLVLSFAMIAVSCKDDKKSETVQVEVTDEINLQTELKIHPISHATMVLNYGNLTLYTDPTGGAEAFSGYNKPDYVIITDIHGDHMDIKTLEALDLKETTLIVPQAVFDKLPEMLQSQSMIMNNGDIKNFDAFQAQAIPMYNLPEDETSRHPKGRGNGYILTLEGERIYISGDTEDITEMRNLKAIDKAFVCMNLPYTMSVDSAASAVLDFKPKQVYPYHYRGTDGLSDVEKFKTLVNEGDEAIKVIQLDWYPTK